MDPTVSFRPAADTRKPYAPEPRAPTGADDQVVVGDIPAQRPGFEPRLTLPAQLSQASQASPAAVLTGTRGVGKTQLAAAYARARLASGWRLIAWVNAWDSGSLLAGLAAIAEALALPAGASQPGAAGAGQALRHWLEADGSRCLLVFDDAQDPALLRPFVPAMGAARVLITVTRESSADLGTRIPVEVFSAEEALALLAGRTGLADRAGGSAVAAELGHLPLALDLAAAVMARQGLDYEGYLAKLRASPATENLGQDEGPAGQPYPSGVAAAVLVSLQTARAADPLGVCAGVLEVMAMLSPATVHRDLLRSAGQAGTLLGGGRRVAASLVDQALEQLKSWSLLGLSVDGQAVSVHCLVAGVIRRELARRGRLTLACQAVAATLEISAEALVKPADPVAARELLGQVTALLDHAETRPADADGRLAGTLRRLRFRALDHLAGLGDSMAYPIETSEPLTADLEAIALLEQTLAGREQVLGPDHPETDRSREHLARAFRDAGRVAEAIPLLQRSLTDRERLLGADHLSTLAARNNLASVYRAAGRAAAAVPLFELNLAACERLLGADHSRTVASRHNLELARQEAALADQVGGDLQDDGA